MLNLGQTVLASLDVTDGMCYGTIVGRKYSVGNSVIYYVVGSSFDGWFTKDESL